MAYYFAYGSNTNGYQMARRCPDARWVGTATLRGWELKERLYADIEPMPCARVYGVVYQISMSDRLNLDRYEGVPTTYEPINLAVWVNGHGWKSCLTYVMTPEARAKRDGKPYPQEYRLRCSHGARMNMIPDAFSKAS